MSNRRPGRTGVRRAGLLLLLLGGAAGGFVFWKRARTGPVEQTGFQGVRPLSSRPGAPPVRVAPAPAPTPTPAPAEAAAPAAPAPAVAEQGDDSDTLTVPLPVTPAPSPQPPAASPDAREATTGPELRATAPIERAAPGGAATAATERSRPAGTPAPETSRAPARAAKTAEKPGSLFEPVTPPPPFRPLPDAPPTVQGDPDAAAAAGADRTDEPEKPARPEPGVELTVTSPYGPGSALPLADGSAPSPEYTIKGNATSKLFHTPASPYFERTKAEAWFRTPEDARAAGFTPWTPRPRPRELDRTRRR